jgi:hypothetical protein
MRSHSTSTLLASTFWFRAALLAQLALPACSAGTRSDGGSVGGSAQEGGSSPNGGTQPGTAGLASSSSTGGNAANGGTAGATNTASGGAGSGNRGGEGNGGRAGGSARDGGAGGGGGSAVDQTVAWVLSYFRPEQTEDADSLHLAYSTDGLHWTGLFGDKPVYKLTGLGTNHIRDPFILRKPDGSFVFIATDWTLADNDADYWNRPSSKLFVAESADLQTFTAPRLLTVTNLTGLNGRDMRAWAPEAYYDAPEQRYQIVWSGDDVANKNTIYISYTTDFRSVSNPTPTVLFAPGYSVIDATIVRNAGVDYLFFKDENNADGGAATGNGKDIQLARSTATSFGPGTFTRASPDYLTRGKNQITRQYTEGPFLIKSPTEDRWYLFADLYTEGGRFGCWTSTDLEADPSTWTRVPNKEYSFPAGVRHGSAVRVTQAQLDGLVAHYP